MAAVTLSAKHQVVIPKDIRLALQLVPGQHMAVRLQDGRVEFVPEKTIACIRGRWPSIDKQIVRDADRV